MKFPLSREAIRKYKKKYQKKNNINRITIFNYKLSHHGAAIEHNKIDNRSPQDLQNDVHFSICIVIANFN